MVLSLNVYTASDVLKSL